MRYLMIPGIGGSDEAHWQSLWEKDLPERTERIAPASWDVPCEEDWLAAIGAKSSAETVLVAHSLGCLAVASFLAAASAPVAAGAFLVAPPDRRGARFPTAAASFSSSLTPLPVPTLVVASSNDPYGSSQAAREMATAWGAALIDAGPLGHINSASGIGDWKAGRDLFSAFSDGLRSSQPNHP
jgi:uncharacterized protein